MIRITIALAALTLGCAAVWAQPGRGVTPAAPTAAQRVALVTGSTDGLGREVARRLAAESAHVIIHGRNVERGKAMVDEIAAGGKGSARFYQADFASLAEVRRLAAEIRRDYRRLDLLVNNAGIIGRQREVSADGHELSFAVNYLSGYLLTYTLMPVIETGRSPRIVNVSSLAAVAQELKGKGIVVQALHPATYMNTTMVTSSGGTPRSTVEEGAAAVMSVIATDAPSGSYFVGQHVGTPHRQSADPEARRQLRDLSRKLTRIS